MERSNLLFFAVVFVILQVIGIEGQFSSTADATSSAHTSGYGYGHSPMLPGRHPFSQVDTYSKKDKLKGRRIVCLFNNMNYRKSRLRPSMIPAELCTHINYEFAILDPKTYELMSSDAELDIQMGFYDEAISLKKQNSLLKVMLSLGGWRDSTKKYSELVKSPEKIDSFISETVPYLKKHGFDGLDVAWEYPNCWQGAIGISLEDKPNFVIFLQVIKFYLFLKTRTAFDLEGLILSISVTAIKREVEAGYDVPAIALVVHYINVMTYDMHGPWEHKTGHHTQFDKKTGDEDPYLNSKAAMELWANYGVPKIKLNLGIGTYGKTFTLVNPSNHGYNTPAKGSGKPGALSKQGGTLCYREICQYLNIGNWTEGEDENYGYYAYSADQWACYDPPMMVVKKVKWVAENGFGGVLIKDLSCDDFEGKCLSMDFPLVKMTRMEFEQTMRRIH
ncbi:probable chitinase 10 [Caerostris extrusa]|uniref:Probable chitinase 10 n=1 Tax=Caerostris extrusa TaxID=172846 RepID=A0AAV4UGY9_CAEEX|nr:probable chitinase 10 [Caerostris extrusa]